jgi:type IV pilus assembly protein PilP
MIGTISISLLLLGGCDSIPIIGGLFSTSGTNLSVDAGQQGPERKEEAQKRDTDEEEYAYNPVGKRDPFRSFLSFASDASILDNIPRTELQKYDIEQYQLTGIIWGMDRPRALVEDPEGIGHVMELGTYVGKKWGKVTSIQDGLVVITEEYQTNEGELVVKPTELRLHIDSMDR